MRTGGAGFSQSSESLQASAHSGPAVSIGAIGAATRGGGLPNGIEIWAATSSAGATTALANIAGSVDVDDAAGRRGRRVGRQPADRLRDLVGRGDPAEWDVGDDLGPAAPLQIFLGHLGYGETGRHSEAQNAVRGIAPGDGLDDPRESPFRRCIMPVLRRIAAIRRAADDIDDPPAFAPVEEVRHGETA